MSKRLFALLLVLGLLLAGCSGGSEATTVPAVTLPNEATTVDETGFTVPGVMKYPDYSFDDTPSNLTLRLKAVAAFKDVLSVRWSSAIPITYNKTGPVSDKTFQHEADVIYAGTIYSNASTGLFQFLEFYDFETGRLSYPGEVDEMKETIGASCADAMIWGVTTVCNSLTGPYYPVMMVHRNGYLPVGNYTYDFNISSYNYLPTNKIAEENGKKVIVEAYTLVRPGDMFVSTPDNHGMMAIGIPTVIYDEDGSVNMDKSYVLIQDQRGGRGAGFYEQEEGGQVIRYSGRTSAKFTFKQLWEKAYLPVTTAEFAGLKEYEKPTASIDKQCATVDELLTATVSSNYPLAVVRIVVSDEFGNTTVLGRKIFGGADKGGVPRSFALSEMECLKTIKGGEYDHPSYTVSVEVVPSSGDRFTVAQIAGQ